jgi:sporulation protein YlmC with PRC-barrel domain
LKLGEFIDQEVFIEGQKIGEIKDVYFDPENWQITHLEIQLTKEAAHEILGAKTSTRNSLAVSALKEGIACCTDDRVELKASKAQLHIYLRPHE